MMLLQHLGHRGRRSRRDATTRFHSATTRRPRGQHRSHTGPSGRPLAVVAGLTITTATSFAHDVYTRVVRRGAADSCPEVRVAKRTVVVIGLLAIIGGIGARGQNEAFLIALAFAVAASANLPTILYSLYWRRFTTRGALFSMYGGLVSSVVLIVLSPVKPCPGSAPSGRPPIE
jgi:Na+(H+)/acetate symporter ActP